MKRARLAPDEQLPGDGPLTPPWPGRAVLLDGATTFVRQTPARVSGAEPALYVHGLGGSSTNWTDLAGLLADRLDGQAIDLPGFGMSDPAPRYTIAALAGRVTRWIEAAGRGPVHLFGNSLGGAIAVRVAATRPDLVRTLTLVSPAMPFLNPRRSLQGRMLPLLVLPRADRVANRMLAQLTPDELARQVLAACYADPSRMPEQRLAEAIEEVRARYTVPHYLTAYVGTMRGLVSSFLRAYLPGSGSLWRLAARITAPTLVIGGRQDRLVDIRVAPQVARVIPDSRLLILDGVGHVAHMEVPRVVARAVLALLDEASARPAPAAGPARPAPAAAPARPVPAAAAARPAPARQPVVARLARAFSSGPRRGLAASGGMVPPQPPPA
ncbi:MAG: alpha/beta hydrolase [Micromonosporaceae bacterium]|jgi:pimeloyl-ACP methyl ester carboxylesterase|nr:alpha/beta hydrolase [Micromonosporaceae bacterium]